MVLETLSALVLRTRTSEEHLQTFKRVKGHLQPKFSNEVPDELLHASCLEY